MGIGGAHADVPKPRRVISPLSAKGASIPVDRHRTIPPDAVGREAVGGGEPVRIDLDAGEITAAVFDLHGLFAALRNTLDARLSTWGGYHRLVWVASAERL